MLKIKSNRLKFRGQKLTELVFFLNAVQHCNGKDIIVEMYPYLSEETRKDDAARNHLRHELFYQEAKEWILLQDLKLETSGHMEFFAQPNFWNVINAKVKEYLIGLDICGEIDIAEV